jgi:hypothetical protein
LIGQHARRVETQRPPVTAPRLNALAIMEIAIVVLAIGVLIWLALYLFTGTTPLPTHQEVLERLAELRQSIGGFI